MNNVKVPNEWPRKKKVKFISISLIAAFVVLSILISVN